MCIILPVDHLPCTHTVAIWQHCIKALRSHRGAGPCSHIRQHSRPVLTRKLCLNCGGPRYFARRGGIAERGQGSSDPVNEKGEEEENGEHNDPNDSGYASDAIMEEDEDADSFSPSPRSPNIAGTVWSTQSNTKSNTAKQTNTPRYCSPNRKPIWEPSLKHELDGFESPFVCCLSVDNSASSVTCLADKFIYAPRSYWAEPASHRDSVVSKAFDIVQERSESPRKYSTLLHPSSPPIEISHPQNMRGFPFPMEESRRPYASPTCVTPPWTPSTALHLSTRKPPINLSTAKEFLFAADRSISLPLTPPQRPGLGSRKGSTLLHPSPPTSTNSVPIQSQLPVRQALVLSKSKSTSATSLDKVVKSPRRGSIIHSCLSDTESEYEFEGEVDTESFQSGDCMTARAGMVSRASRINSHGAEVRVLEMP